ncbi:DMT family transporter [Galbibacter sp.]|uniref:DMT family transporter n=1 Tax=Galbibacter sp. TaxID=2918471 RepID=UPI002BE59F2E|nr:DMT family transporter [Galbibacter sp.]HLV63129.1 DMT family transporter [Galbibacter sp.]
MAAQKNHLQQVAQLNFAVICISTSGVWGRYITLEPEQIIFFRAFLALVFVYLLCRFNHLSLKLEKGKDTYTVLWCGLCFGIHWVSYFYALSLSSVAIGMLAIYTYPVITSFLEPVLLKTSFVKAHLVLGVLVITGIYFLVPDIDFSNSQFVAICLGVISAFFYAVRNIMIKPKVQYYNGSVLMMYQLLVISILMAPLLYFTNFSKLYTALPGIVFLALITTTLGHTLLLRSLKYFSATTASIMSSVQPVYGIVMGMLFLGEFPAWHTLIGGALILTAVGVENIRTFKGTAGRQ